MLRSARTATKILIALLASLALMLATGAVGFAAARNLSGHLEDLSDARLPGLNALWVVSQAVTDAERHLNALLLPGADDALRKRTTTGFRDAQQRIDDGSYAFVSLPHDPETVALWTEATEKLEAWRALARKVTSIASTETGAGFMEQGSKKAALLEETRQAGVGVDAVLGKLIAKTAADAAISAANGHAAARRGAVAVVVTLLVGAALLTAFGAGLVRAVNRTVKTLVSEAARLRDAVAAGALSVRGEVSALDAEFKPIVEGMNETMDAFERPLRLTVECVGRLGRGDIPGKITDDYQGDFGLIKTSLNDCVDAVNALLADATMLAQAGVEGRLSARADATRHKGDFRKIVEGVNDTLDAVVGPLTVAAGCVDRLSRGDIPEPIREEYRGDFDLLKRNLNTCVEAVNALFADARSLASAALAGQLGVRADPARHSGEFRAFIQGVNDTLDAVVTPFRMVADHCQRISHGELPPRWTSEARGDLVPMQAGLNRCVDSLALLVADADRLALAAVNGELSNRADPARHEGAFRSTIEGVNRTLDAVLAPVSDAAAVLEQLAQRDLRARVTGRYQGEHAKIAAAVNSTADALHEALAQVAQAVDQVSSAAAQIASSSQAVASGASEQASSLQETSSAIETVAGMTRQATESARHASQLAGSARDAAADGAATIEQMQGAMARIKASAEGTSQIIRDINDIAFQTNLLALNAAVEAARAGEAGRGFAVVAEEVRSLALRAKEAAAKTEELIRQSVKEAAEGEVTAKQVAQKLGEIAGGVSKVTDIVGEIATAAGAQSTGLEQVESAVAEMDKVTQQNAASAEQSSSAASELSGQAEELHAMVGTFRLATGGARADAPGPGSLPEPSPRAGAIARSRRGSGPAPRARGAGP
jgi:methyl-accepting chemotaxis protein